MMIIQEYRFGYMKISGKGYTTDLKIIGDKVISNWWRKQGHRVFKGDVEDLIKEGVEVIIIGQGDPGMMRVDTSLKNYLKKT